MKITDETPRPIAIIVPRVLDKQYFERLRDVLAKDVRMFEPGDPMTGFAPKTIFVHDAYLVEAKRWEWWANLTRVTDGTKIFRLST